MNQVISGVEDLLLEHYHISHFQAYHKTPLRALANLVAIANRMVIGARFLEFKIALTQPRLLSHYLG